MFQNEQLATRKQGRIYFKAGVFRRGSNERNGPFFDRREQGILLRFGKTVDFINEEHAATRLKHPVFFRSVNFIPDTLTPLEIALMAVKGISTCSASNCARVVLPTPGGPQNRREGKRF